MTRGRFAVSMLACILASACAYPWHAVCGIAGIYSPDGRPIDRRILKRMADSIAHRGPDAEGFYVSQGSPSVGLANRRLAVIDIEGGDQPFQIESGAFTIVYN